MVSCVFVCLYCSRLQWVFCFPFIAFCHLLRYQLLVESYFRFYTSWLLLSVNQSSIDSVTFTYIRLLTPLLLSICHHLSSSSSCKAFFLFIFYLFIFVLSFPLHSFRSNNRLQGLRIMDNYNNNNPVSPIFHIPFISIKNFSFCFIFFFQSLILLYI